MSPARSFFVAVVSAFIALSLSTADAATIAPAYWNRAVGTQTGNQTVLPVTSFGTSVGPFTPPASEGTAAQKLAGVPQSKVGKPGGIFICLNVDWNGVCGYAVQPLNECILLASPWLNAISSFGPDNGATCFAFSTGNCDTTQAQWSFKFPGDDSGGLATTNPWNDKITSFACTAS